MKIKPQSEILVLSITSLLLIGYASFHLTSGAYRIQINPKASRSVSSQADIQHAKAESVTIASATLKRPNKSYNQLLDSANSAFTAKAEESLVYDPETGDSLTEPSRQSAIETDSLDLDEETLHRNTQKYSNSDDQTDHDVHQAVEAPEDFSLALHKN